MASALPPDTFLLTVSPWAAGAPLDHVLLRSYRADTKAIAYGRYARHLSMLYVPPADVGSYFELTWQLDRFSWFAYPSQPDAENALRFFFNLNHPFEYGDFAAALAGPFSTVRSAISIEDDNPLASLNSLSVAPASPQLVQDREPLLHRLDQLFPPGALYEGPIKSEGPCSIDDPYLHTAWRLEQMEFELDLNGKPFFTEGFIRRMIGHVAGDDFVANVVEVVVRANLPDTTAPNKATFDLVFRDVDIWRLFRQARKQDAIDISREWDGAVCQTNREFVSTSDTEFPVAY
ncbi:hypothetical protein JCM5296_000074 [Sporobolomyces johnsonii]